MKNHKQNILFWNIVYNSSKSVLYLYRYANYSVIYYNLCVYKTSIKSRCWRCDCKYFAHKRIKDVDHVHHLFLFHMTTYITFHIPLILWSRSFLFKFWCLVVIRFFSSLSSANKRFCQHSCLLVLCKLIIHQFFTWFDTEVNDNDDIRMSIRTY